MSGELAPNPNDNPWGEPKESWNEPGNTWDEPEDPPQWVKEPWDEPEDPPQWVKEPWGEPEVPLHRPEPEVPLHRPKPEVPIHRPDEPLPEPEEPLHRPKPEVPLHRPDVPWPEPEEPLHRPKPEGPLHSPEEPWSNPEGPWRKHKKPWGNPESPWREQTPTPNDYKDLKKRPLFDSPEILKDRSEQLAEYHEKLKEGIKIVVAGPSNSGKSVFIESLIKNLESNGTPSSDTTPSNKSKVKIIDINDYTDEEKTQILKGATHAIILTNNLSKVAEWRDFFEKHNIEVIAKLHSHYQGNRDIQLPMEPRKNQITGSVHHLEQGESAVDRETIKQVANLINEITEYNK